VCVVLCSHTSAARYTDRGEVVVFVFEVVAATDPFGGLAVSKSLVGECLSLVLDVL
jgi:hypothetical protein